MKKWMRLIAVLVLLSMCLSALIACNNDPVEDPTEPGDPSNSQPSPETPEGENPGDDTPQLLDPSKALILVSDKKTDYVIIRDDAASTNVKSMVTAFRNQFFSKTQVDIKVKDDREEEGRKEIIVSMMDGRTQPEQEYAKLTAPQGKGYRISIVGESIVVASQEEYLQEALDLLMMAISDCGNGIWGVPEDYEGKLDIPKFSKEGKLYDVGEGNYVYNVENVTAEKVDEYMTLMGNDGFNIYSEHSVGNSKFFTYIKDSIYGQMVVYTMYHPKLTNFRLTYGPMEYLPNVVKQAADTKAEPTITQTYMQMLYDKVTVESGVVTKNGDPSGMSYLIQLSDGRFIVIDGGKEDGTFRPVTKQGDNWVAGAAQSSNDGKRLYDTMNAMKPADHAKPQIAMWYISHPHADHYDLARQFIVDYKNKINLELVAYNVSASADLPEKNENYINTFRSQAKEFYGAEFWEMHTGQVMQFPGATIEVLSTVEDIYCKGNKSLLSDLNNTSAVIRIHIGEMSFMVLGDAYETTNRFIADAYGDALKSDIMQLAHHGANGATQDLYKKIDPQICLWPTDEFTYLYDDYRLGTHYSGNYKFNKWLRDPSNGVREHYAASYTTIINANTGEVTKKKDGTNAK